MTLTPAELVARISDDLSLIVAAARCPTDEQVDRALGLTPTTLGEWLTRASRLAFLAASEAPAIAGLVRVGGDQAADPDDQVAAAESMLDLAAALWLALEEADGPWSTALERSVRDHLTYEAAARYDGVRLEQDGLSGAMDRIGTGLFAYTAHVSRGGSAPRDVVSTELRAALTWLLAAWAATGLTDLLRDDPAA